MTIPLWAILAGVMGAGYIALLIWENNRSQQFYKFFTTRNLILIIGGGTVLIAIFLSPKLAAGYFLLSLAFGLGVRKG